MERVQFEELNFLIREKNFRELKQKLEKLNKIDAASFIETSGADAVHFFRLLSKKEAADVFIRFTVKMQRRLINLLTERELSCIIEHLFISDAGRFLKKMPAGAVKRILDCAAPQRKKLIGDFLSYPKNSVGSIMSAEFVELNNTMSVKEAFGAVRKNKRETVYNCYVTDENHILEGAVSLRALLSSREETLIKDIMKTDVLHIEALQDKKTAVRLISKYGLLSVAVADDQKRMAGIVTIDDIIKIRQDNLLENLKLRQTYPFLHKYRYAKTSKQL